MENVFKILKYYKGEKDNSFDWQKENYKNQFWEYEKTFINKLNAGIEFKNIKPAEALKIYLDKLFVHLADKYETTTDYFKRKYND